MDNVKKGLLRIIDANFNRSKEGLRVAEDIMRFIIEDDRLRKKIRKIRHGLDVIAEEDIIKSAILSRDSKSDLGKNVDMCELKRESILDLLYINLQRVKESLRVLEEVFKLILPKKVKALKALRYELYTLEKEFSLTLN